MSNVNKRSAARRIGRLALYAVPGYAVVKAFGSLKATVSTGAKTLGDRNRELAAQRKNPRVATYNEAIAKRPEDAMPLEAIEQSSIFHKRFFLAIAAVASAFLIGSTIGGNYLGTFLGALFVMFCLMLALKYEHRLWQLETGRAAPDKPLGGYRKFFRARGALLRIISPRLF